MEQRSKTTLQNTDKKINDKYKKENILKMVENEWGYSNINGEIIFVKNCILKGKYNKIYQIISSGDEAIDGLYIINSYDVNLYTDAKKDKKVIEIIYKKYDKFAGTDGFCIRNFNNSEDYINFLTKKNFINKDEMIELKKADIEKLQEFKIDGN